MKTTRALTLVITAFAISGCVTVSESARRGRTDAKADVQRGKLAIETAGMPAPWVETYARLMQKRYAVELRTVGTCMIADDDAEHCRAYNEVMIAEISRRYGSDVFEKTEAEARSKTSSRSH